MDIDELYFLNDILDERPLTLIPRASSPASTLVAESIIDSLARQGLLTTDRQLADGGIRLLNRLRRYKSASKHVRIGGLYLGIDEEGAGVGIVHNPAWAMYSVRKVVTVHAAEGLLTNLRSLRESLPPLGSTPVTMQVPEFFALFHLESRNHVRLTVHTRERVQSDEVFATDGAAYLRYDCVAESLHIEKRSQVVDALAARIEEP